MNIGMAWERYTKCGGVNPVNGIHTNPPLASICNITVDIKVSF